MKEVYIVLAYGIWFGKPVFATYGGFITREAAQEQLNKQLPLGWEQEKWEIAEVYMRNEE